MAMNSRLLRPLATGFNPKSIAGLAVWLDAADASTITLNGSDVSQWADKSGNGNNLTQATAAAQPEYEIGGLNGKNVLKATGSEYMGFSGSGLDVLRNVGGATMFVVHKPTDVAGGNEIVFYWSTGANSASFRFGFQYNLIGTWQAGGRRSDADSFSGTNFGSPASDTLYLHSFVVDYASAELRIYQEGGIQATTDPFLTGGNTSDTASVSAGVMANAINAASPYSGQFAELLVYQRALSDSERGRVERALAGKWGVTLA